MGSGDSDRELLAFVQRQINTGTTRIRIPVRLMASASDEALEAVRQLCKLNGVAVEVEG